MCILYIMYYVLTLINLQTSQVLRSNVRQKMFDIIDGVNFMLPHIKKSAVFSVYKQMYDTSTLELACDLFFIKTFNDKLTKMVDIEADTMSFTMLGESVNIAVDALADALRVRFRAF